MTKLTFEDVLKVVITEMCNRVGANYDDMNFQEANWFYKYEWTEEKFYLV